MIQEEIVKENLGQELKSKKGVLHEILLDNSNGRSLVKIFEKKISLDSERKFFLHVGLRRLGFENLKPKISKEEF